MVRQPSAQSKIGMLGFCVDEPQSVAHSHGERIQELTAMQSAMGRTVLSQVQAHHCLLRCFRRETRAVT